MYEWLGSQILDMSSLSIRERVIFVNEVCRNLYDNHVNGYSYKEFLVFEEAQTYLPNGCMRLSTRKQNLFDGVLDIVTVGANYGIRFGLITQFPAMVDKAPVKICQQRYFGWTWEKNDVQYLKGFLSKDWIARLQDLKRGQFIYENCALTQKIEIEPFPIPKVSATAFSQMIQVKEKATYQLNYALDSVAVT